MISKNRRYSLVFISSLLDAATGFSRMGQHQIGHLEVALGAFLAVGLAHAQTVCVTPCLHQFEASGVAHVLSAAHLTHDVEDAILWTSKLNLQVFKFEIES
jgi:hypothetical protein